MSDVKPGRTIYQLLPGDRVIYNPTDVAKTADEVVDWERCLVASPEFEDTETYVWVISFPHGFLGKPDVTQELVTDLQPDPRDE